MKASVPIMALAVAGFLAQPLSAQDKAPEDDGLSLIQRGIMTLMQNVMREIGPDLDRIGRDMSDSLSRFAPALDDLSVLIDDIGNYTAPERLKNGDIIIRRKPGAPPPPPIGQDLRDLARPPAHPDPARPDPALPEDDIPTARDPSQPEIAL